MKLTIKSKGDDDLMDFETAFLHSLRISPHLTSGLDKTVLYGTLYEQNPLTSRQLITLYSRGTIEAGFPFFYDISGMDCYCFLYTISGSGKIEGRGGTDSLLLTKESLLFFDCNQPFTLQTAAAPWKFKILFAGGGNLPFYMKAAKNPFGCLLRPIANSELIHSFHLLFKNNTAENIIYKLTDEKNMTDLCVMLLSHLLEIENPILHVPEYLMEMKQLFDTHYEHSYSLDELESNFSISKYRLCREFSNYFGESPIQYLNRVRIANSKILLQNTNLKVHEIGTKVGIENTNHFINLFKRQEGITPLMYRETRLLY